MFLKLTSSDNIKLLVNMDNVLSIADDIRGIDKGIMISFIGDSDEYVFVKESFEEIELMLKGPTVSTTVDPRSRDVIGGMGDAL